MNNTASTPGEAERATLAQRPVPAAAPDAEDLIQQRVTLAKRPATAVAPDPEDLLQERATLVKRPAPAAAPDPEDLLQQRATLAKRPVTAAVPDPEELLQLSSATRDPQEALDYAQRAVELNPDDARAQGALQRAMLAKLNQDAFVAFLAETAKTYVVHLRQPRPLVVPKTRAQPEVFPPDKRTPGEHVWVLVWWLILGLVPAGVGALLFSPVVFARSLAVLNKPGVTPRDRKLALSALGATIALALLGAAFTLLLILHTIG